ncbi:MAG: glutaredoxin family protein [Thermoleophilaceae bacterium]
MRRPAPPRLTLYAKPGCHLCEEARATVLSLREELDFELEEVDVSLDARLHRAYGERIPVVAIDDEDALELGVEATQLRRLLSVAIAERSVQ